MIWILSVIMRHLKKHDIDLVKEEILKGTQLGMKTIKL
jgi:hypothetical protein